MTRTLGIPLRPVSSDFSTLSQVLYSEVVLFLHIQAIQTTRIMHLFLPQYPFFKLWNHILGSCLLELEKYLFACWEKFHCKNCPPLLYSLIFPHVVLPLAINFMCLSEEFYEKSGCGYSKSLSSTCAKYGRHPKVTFHRPPDENLI